MAAHFADSPAGAGRLPDGADPFVVEIGSNDGIMLRHFAAAGIRHLGVEPSANVAEVASAKGVSTIWRFFDEQLARRIVAEHGQADAFIAANVMCHIPYLHSVVGGRRASAEAGRRADVRGSLPGRHRREDVLRSDLRRARLLLLASSSDSRLFERARPGSRRRACRRTVHGGSMRYVVARKGARPVSPARRGAARDEERASGLAEAETYVALREQRRALAR